MKTLRKVLTTKVEMSALRGDVEYAVLAYTPETIAPRDWRTVRDRVLACVVVLAPTTEKMAKDMARFLGVYLVSLLTAGMTMDDTDEALFAARRVERFIGANPLGLAGISIHNLRFLRVYAKELNPNDAWPVRTPAAFRHRRSGPYTPAEVTNIVSALGGLRQGKTRDRMTITVNTILGCGASAAELLVLTWDAFVPVPNLGLMVALPGGASRRADLPARAVPVAEPYASVLLPLAEARDGKIVSAHDVNVFAKAANSDSGALRGVPPVTTGRLRTTWMWERAAAGVSLIDIAVAAGVRLEAVAHALDGHIAEDNSARTLRNFVKALR